MKNSVLLRRIILLLLSALILSGLLSVTIYIFVTQKMYVQMRADELKPIARTIADMLADIGEGTRHGGWRLLERDNKNFLGALLHVFDVNGNSIMNPPSNAGTGANPPIRENTMTQTLSGELKTVLSGGEVSEIRRFSGNQSNLIVGVPIIKDNVVIGAVIFTKSTDELSDAMRGMYITLFISTFAAFLIMLIPGYFMTRWLVVPIRQMRDVARAMSHGDFSVRADAAQKGEIGELARAMNHFASGSGLLEQTRRDYVANVSHELRTPIAAIRAMGETLRDGMAKDPEKQQFFYTNIVRESMRLSRLVDDLLELSRLQSSTEPLKKVNFDLREVIQNITDVYSHAASAAGHEFVFYMDMDKALPVCSNPDRIEQILIVFLDNALKHTPNGGTVTLTVNETADTAELSVSDNGPGIPDEDIPHIFERFYTVDKSHTGCGTGLGLSIANEIIKGLGGIINVQSDCNGTTFMFAVQKV